MVPLAVALLRWLRGRRALPLFVAAAALLCLLRLRRRPLPPAPPAPAAAGGPGRASRVTFAPRPVVSDSVGPYVPWGAAVAATARIRAPDSSRILRDYSVGSSTRKPYDK